MQALHTWLWGAQRLCAMSAIEGVDPRLSQGLADKDLADVERPVVADWRATRESR